MTNVLAPIFQGPADLCNFFMNKPDEFGDLCVRVMESLGYIDGRTRVDGDKFYMTFRKNVIRCVCQCGNVQYTHQVSARDLYDAKAFFDGASYKSYITGSVFQPAAVEYAEKHGIHLVNGHLLLLLMRKANLLDMEGHYRMRNEKKDDGVSANNMQRMDPRKFSGMNRKP
jgi:hypothetical protein